LKYENYQRYTFAAATAIEAFSLGNAHVERANREGVISVTGLSSEDFVSDLIVWEGRFVRESNDLKAAYSALEKDKGIIIEYLLSRGITKEQLV